MVSFVNLWELGSDRDEQKVACSEIVEIFKLIDKCVLLYEVNSVTDFVFKSQ